MPPYLTGIEGPPPKNISSFSQTNFEKTGWQFESNIQLRTYLTKVACFITDNRQKLDKNLENLLIKTEIN